MGGSSGVEPVALTIRCGRRAETEATSARLPICSIRLSSEAIRFFINCGKSAMRFSPVGGRFRWRGRRRGFSLPAARYGNQLPPRCRRLPSGGAGADDHHVSVAIHAPHFIGVTVNNIRVNRTAQRARAGDAMVGAADVAGDTFAHQTLFFRLALSAPTPARQSDRGQWR